MRFEKKDFEQLHITKIRLCDQELPICSKYFFCMDKKMIFITKNKKYFHILASAQCNLDPIGFESVFEIVYGSSSFEETLKKFNELVKAIIDWRIII